MSLALVCVCDALTALDILRIEPHPCSAAQVSKTNAFTDSNTPQRHEFIMRDLYVQTASPVCVSINKPTMHTQLQRLLIVKAKPDTNNSTPTFLVLFISVSPFLMFLSVFFIFSLFSSSTSLIHSPCTRSPCLFSRPPTPISLSACHLLEQ